MDLDFPEEIILKKNNDILNEVLENKILIDIESISLKEDYKNNVSKVLCTLFFYDIKKNKISVEAEGKGVVDALFNALLNKFAEEFVSLKSIKLYDFIVKIQFNKSRTPFQTDAPVEIKIVLESTNRKKLYFKHSSSSLVKAAGGALCQAIAYLINAERAVVQLHQDILYARKRQRTDLESGYTSQLVELVRTVPYSSVLEKAENK
jgi:hypothetical protein